MCHLTWWHFDVLRYRQGVECLSVVWVIAMMSSYSLCFALCCGWPGLVVHADVSPVLSPDSVALVSSLSPAAPVVASWHVVPAAAERQMFITHLFNYSRYTVFFYCFLLFVLHQLLCWYLQMLLYLGLVLANQVLVLFLELTDE